MSQIANLVSIIKAGSERIDNYLAQNRLPLPGFDVDAPVGLELPENLEAVRQNVLNATAELQELLLGPKEHLYSLDQGSNNLVCLHAIYQYRIATLFPLDEEATFQQISESCGINKPDVRRLLRLATSYHIFEEIRKEVIVHTAASRILAQDSQMQDWLGSLCEEIWPSAVQSVPAMIKWPNSQEPEHSGFALANHIEQSIYQELAKYPERARRFAGSMAGYTTGPGFSSEHLVDNIEWESIGSGVVVDLGGSHGEMMIAVARKFPTLNFVIQDLPLVLDSRPPLPEDMNDRIIYMAHDFFKEQPVKNADVYFFRWVFHGWSDKYCLLILRNLIPALKDGARIVINDFCLPEPNTLPMLTERRIRIMDIAQLNIQNSREREREEYEELFHQADKRFKFLGVKTPSGSFLSIIEVVWSNSAI